MNRYEAAFAGVHATPEFKDRLTARLNQECRTLANTPKTPKPMFSSKRKALLICIAAVLLLLSACAAYAVYWSSTQRAKEYTQSEQATDDRLALATRMADESIAGTTFFSSIEGTAEVDGLSLALVGVCFYPNERPPEVHLAFNASDAKTNDNSRLVDFDYVLTVGGKEYPAYAKADGTVRGLPAIAMADTTMLGAGYETWFRIDDQEIVSGMPMTLSCTLYDWAQDGQRGESLGSFSLDFVYTVPTEQIALERERLIEENLAYLDAQAQNQSEALANLPDEMTQLNITQEEYTFHDAQVSKDGLLLGVTRVTDGSEAAEFYMDGYRLEAEPVSHIFTPDTARPQLHLMPWEEVQYFGTYESVLKYPWYAPLNELPETVLIAVLRNEGSHRMAKGDDENDPITYSWNKVAFLFRVNPRTGEVTLPKDDAERDAWREETLRLAEDGRNNDHIATLSGSQTVNGVTMSLFQLYVKPNSGSVYIDCVVDGMYYPGELARSLVHLTINGVEQDTTDAEELISQYGFSKEHANEWVRSYGGWQIHNDWIAGQNFGL
ncbi:MAG: hypothetical protein VB061_06040 [Christensenella sp.]|nr:hypothetical protein [Christensenella sp.]